MDEKFETDLNENIIENEQDDRSEDKLKDNSGAGNTDTKYAEIVKVMNEQKEILNVLNTGMSSLQQIFRDKIERDSHKERLFDEMHGELQRHREGMYDSMLDPFIMELIEIIDRIKKQYAYLPEECTEESYTKARKQIRDIRGDLEDLLESMDVDRFQSEGDTPDLKHQKVVKSVPTDDPALDNTIEKRMSDGYVKGDRIIRHEKVSVYKLSV